MLVDIDTHNKTLPRKTRSLKYIKKADLVEIDKNKAFTAAFINIFSIGCFNEFDIWKRYDNEPIQHYSLYQIKHAKHNLFFNKSINIVYGAFVKPGDVQYITHVKVPSTIKKVPYKELIDELWKTPISPKPKEDKDIKKAISNTNFGMLEKLSLIHI